MLTRNPAKNIDEVIARLTDIIDISRQESSRQGYFAALYRKVTINVKQGILNGRFEDGARMERLDVNFAVRLNSLGENERIAVVKQRDLEISALGRLVYKPPGVFLNLGLLAIRMRESNDVAKVINILS